MSVLKRSVMVGACALVALGSINSWGASEKVTFTKDVLPILQENCQVCHRPAGRNMSGMVAPMSLLSYKEVRPWAKAIVRAVEAKAMPPWHASEATHDVFANERTLTDAEVATIVSWVEQGASRGNPKDAPPAVTFPEGWMMGEPDLELSFAEPFFVNDDVRDLYERIELLIPEGALAEDKWVRSIEFMPGSEAVHHVIAYTMTPGEEGERVNRQHLGGLAPGTDAANYPEGYGKMMPAGSKLVLQMHYHKEPGPGTGIYDMTKMAIKFHDAPVQHAVSTTPISYGPFEIPPFHPNWKVGASRTFDQDIDLLSLMPHTHLRGKSAKYTAYYPDGTSELLLEVPAYDFNWQTAYFFKEIKKIPAGTRIEWEIYYDNSKENAEESGFNAARAVSFGSPTTDEMDLGWMTFSPTAPNVSAGAGD